MRISDWSSDVCSSDLEPRASTRKPAAMPAGRARGSARRLDDRPEIRGLQAGAADQGAIDFGKAENLLCVGRLYRSPVEDAEGCRSEEHTSELQSLMRISYAVFCLNKKKNTIGNNTKDI